MAKPDPNNRRRSAGRLGVVAAVLLAIGAIVFAWSRGPEGGLPRHVSESDFRRAELRFRELYRRTPTRIDTLMMLGEMASSEHDEETAISCFLEIPSEHPRYGLPARLQEGELLIQAGRAREAESSLRAFLELAAGNPSVPAEERMSATHWLSYLLSVELRFEERKQLLAEAHRRREVDVNDSKLYFFPHLLLWNRPSARDPLRTFLERDPQNHRLTIAQARFLTGEGRLDEAWKLLTQLRSERADDLDVAAAMLECRFEKNDWAGFADVAQSLPAYREGQPWLLTRMRGEYAAHQARWKEAARYFTDVLREDPTDPKSTMGLGRAYDRLGEAKEHERMLQRSLVLAEIRVGMVKVTESDPEASRALARKCERIGLKDAAEAFDWHAERIRHRRSSEPSTAGRPDSEPAEQ